MIRTRSRHPGGVPRTAGSCDPTVEGAAPARGALPWLSPRTATIGSGLAAVNATGGGQPGYPLGGPDTAGRGLAARADDVAARRSRGRDRRSNRPGLALSRQPTKGGRTPSYISSPTRLSTGRQVTSKTRGHTVRGPPEKRRPDGRRARGRFVRRRGEWYSLNGRTAGQCVSALPPRGGMWASPPAARPARPPAMDRVDAPRVPEAEPSPHETPAASGSSTLRVTARTFAPAARPARPLATERVPAPRAPDGEPSPRDAPAASGSPTLRAIAQMFAPGQGVRD